MSEKVTIDHGFAEALLQARKNVKPIVKNATNPFLKNKYADLTTVIEAVSGALMDAGILISQGSAPEAGGILVNTTLLHVASGEQARNTVWMPLKAQTPQDAAGALTYGRRYGLLSIMCLPTEDDDGNDASGIGTQPASGSSLITADQKKTNEAAKNALNLFGKGK